MKIADLNGSVGSNADFKPKGLRLWFESRSRQSFSVGTWVFLALVVNTESHQELWLYPTDPEKKSSERKEKYIRMIIGTLADAFIPIGPE
jgi:hypothetical protein